MIDLNYDLGTAIRQEAELVARRFGEHFAGYDGESDQYKYQTPELLITDAIDWLSVQIKPWPLFPGYVEVFKIGGISAQIDPHYPLFIWRPVITRLYRAGMSVHTVQKGFEKWTLYLN